MNEKQLEQTHVDETIELIQIEQNMLDTKQQEIDSGNESFDKRHS